MGSDEQRVVVGTGWNDGPGHLHVLCVSPEGAVREESKVETGHNPMWCCQHPVLPRVYVVDANGDGGQGAVRCYDSSGVGKGGGLELLATTSSGGSGPCHVATDLSGQWLLTVNYDSGNVVSRALDTHGLPAPAPACVVQHDVAPLAPGFVESRQGAPHTHHVIPTPSNNHVVVCDLGQDHVSSYALDHNTGRLTLAHRLHTPPGTGPRHTAFAPTAHAPTLPSSLQCACVGELDNSVTLLVVGRDDGSLRAVRRVSLLFPPSGGGSLPPPPFPFYTAPSHAAEVAWSPSGRWVLVSLRGADAIAVVDCEGLFDEGKEEGKEDRALVREFATQGGLPWSFAQCQGTVVVANQFSAARPPTAPGCVVPFAWDEASGALSALPCAHSDGDGDRAVWSHPMCMFVGFLRP